jgi:GTP-binding protein YchF
VRDERVDQLSALSNSAKTIYATIEFVDIAGLVKGAGQGEGLGNKFLSHIRQVDAIVHVLRYFQDSDITHVHGEVDPMEDAQIINLELIFADLQQIEKSLPQIEKKAKSKDPKASEQVKALQKVHTYLQEGIWLYTVRNQFTDKDMEHLCVYNLLSMKPMIYALNVSQEDIHNAPAIQSDYQEKLHAPVAIVCARLEEEMIEFSAQERKEYLLELTQSEHIDHIPTLDDLIGLAFKTVGLMYYFTTGDKETKAWTIPIASTAPQAAGAIHTDFQKGFIKADVVSSDVLIAAGSRSAAREK